MEDATLVQIVIKLHNKFSDGNLIGEIAISLFWPIVILAWNFHLPLSFAKRFSHRSIENNINQRPLI